MTVPDRYNSKIIQLLVVMLGCHLVMTIISLYSLFNLRKIIVQSHQRFELHRMIYDLQWIVGHEIVWQQSASSLGYGSKFDNKSNNQLDKYKDLCDQIEQFAKSSGISLLPNSGNWKQSIEDAQSSRLSHKQFAISFLESLSIPETESIDNSNLVWQLILSYAALIFFAASFLWQQDRRNFVAPLRLLAQLCSSPVGDERIKLLQPTPEFLNFLRLLQNARTEMSRSETEEQRMIDNSGVFVCSLNRQGLFDFANSFSDSLIGVPCSELKGRKIEEIVFDEDLESFRECLNSSWHKETILEVRLLHREGRIVYSRWSIIYARSEQRLFCVVQDLSEEKLSEAMRQENTRIICSDLHAPLNTMLELLAEQRSVLNEAHLVKAEAEISALHSSLESMRKMVEDLYSMRSFDKDLVLHCSEHQLNGIIQEAVRTIRSYALSKEIEIESDVSENMFVNCDRSLIIQVLVNLISNAIKFSPIRTKVSVYALNVDNNIEIRIADSGPGIPCELSEAIFEPFNQVSVRQSHGYGLGLSICKMVIDAHGGVIAVRPNQTHEIGQEKSTGSEFWFRLRTKIEPVNLSY